jgi:hypothetical protein
VRYVYFLLAALVGVSSAAASTVTIDYSGVVDNLIDNGGFLAGISMGDPVSGTLTFDTSALDQLPGPQLGLYGYWVPPAHIEVTVGGQTFANDFTADTTWLTNFISGYLGLPPGMITTGPVTAMVGNDIYFYSGYTDALAVVGVGTASSWAAMPPFLGIGGLAVVFADFLPPLEMFGNDDLPEVVDLASVNFAHGYVMSAAPGSIYGYILGFQITSAQQLLAPAPDPQIPEPGTFVLMATGLAGILYWRRRR